MQPLLAPVQDAHQKEFTLVYVAKDPRRLESELLEALALGKGPDIVSMPQDLLYRQSDKLWPIPFETFPLRTFQDTFTRGSDIYVNATGVLGLPLTVDPLVLYYNQDLLANARLATVPTTWKGLGNDLKVLVKADARNNIAQAGIALGQFNNIDHAKDILVTLMLQAGNPVVDYAQTPPRAVLKEALGFAKPPAGEALNFFNLFSDPTNSLYSWNSSLTEARQSFLRGQLVMYLGYASEYAKLREQNPQLNFDVAAMPQREGSVRDVVAGNFSALSILNASRNKATALQVAYLLTGSSFAKSMSDKLLLPPVRNDLLRQAPTDPAAAVFYQSAIITRSWLDPAPAATGDIFRTLAEDTRSGKLDANQALLRANSQLEQLMQKGSAAAAVLAAAPSLVPCTNDCNFNSLVSLVGILFDFIVKIALPLSAVIMAYAGIMIVLHPGNDGVRKKSISIIISVVWGLVFILAAYLIVKTILDYFLADWLRPRVGV
jgi:ABC-type glycerol-3-phosphate transport system substrate-binding protein